jgi:hypothetical protein
MRKLYKFKTIRARGVFIGNCCTWCVMRKRTHCLLQFFCKIINTIVQNVCIISIIDEEYTQIVNVSD